MSIKSTAKSMNNLPKGKPVQNNSTEKQTKTNPVKSINYILGLVLSCFSVCGYYLEKTGAVPFNKPKTYLLIIGFALVYAGLSAILFAKLASQNTSVKTVSKKSNSKLFLLSFGIIWICYFIVFLGVYPGFFVYDAQYELMETITRHFTTQQPLLHVLFMGAIVQGIHLLTTNYNIAIAVFILVQMTLVSLCSAFFIKELAVTLTNRSRLFTIIFSLYLGIFPVPVMYALCSAKDGLFGGCILILFLCTKKMMADYDSFFKNRKNIFIFIIFSVLMMMLRPNGIYAYILFGLFLFNACRHEYNTLHDRKIQSEQQVLNIIELPDDNPICQKYRPFSYISNPKYVAIVLIVSICLSLSGNKVLEIATNAEDYGIKDALSIPIQQLARLYAYDNESLSKNEIQEIGDYIPVEAMARYNPKCADPVKIDFNEQAFSEDSSGFFTIWFIESLSHPFAYFNAHGMTTYGLWYPFTVIDGYKGNQVFTFVYDDSSYFGYETEEPGFRNSKIPFIDRFYRWISLDSTIQKIPVISLLFSPGFLIWILLISMSYFIYIGRKKLLLPYLPAFFTYLTCLVGPMSLVRYTFYFWILVPVIIIEVLINSVLFD